MVQNMKDSQKESTKILMRKIQASKDVKKLCQISSTELNQTMMAGGGFLNDGLKFTGYPIVGYNNYMQSSFECQPNPTTDHNQKANICLANANHLKANDIICSWDSRVNGSFFFHTSIAIPLSRSIEDIKFLRDLNPKAFCGIDYYRGFLMHFIKKSEAYLGFNEDIVNIEFFYYHSRQPNAPRWNEDVMEEIEQLFLKKYGVDANQCTNDARDKGIDNAFVVIINERRVRLSNTGSDYLYALCRCWIRNDILRKDQHVPWDSVRPLPRPLFAGVAERSKDKSTEDAKEKGTKIEIGSELEEALENISEHQLLQAHVKHAKTVRARLRAERTQRIGRFKHRLSLLLPSSMDQNKSNSVVPS